MHSSLRKMAIERRIYGCPNEISKRLKKRQAQQFRDSQNWIRQLSLHQKLSTDVRKAAHETLRLEVANKPPLEDALLPKKNGD